MLKKVIVWLGCFWFAGLFSASAEPLNILYVGASYMGPIRTIVDDLAVGGGFDAPSRFSHYAGGSRLYDHVEGRASDATPPIRYWMDGGTTNWGDNPSNAYEGVIYDSLASNETWDILFIQGLSSEANDTHSGGDSAAFRSNAVLLADRVLEHSPNAKLVLQETWARAYGSGVYDPEPPINPVKWENPAAMHAETAGNYDLAKEDIEAAHPGSSVILTDLGDAWATLDWDRTLYKDDLSHHSTTGQVLAALVAYSKFYNDYTSDMAYTTNGSGIVDSPISATLAVTKADWTNLVHVADATVRGFALETSTASINVPEGGANTFGVRLTSVPDSAVTVTVARASGDTNITVTGGGTLTFLTNTWQTYQPVTLRAAQDDDWANSSAVIRCSSDVLEDLYVTATEDDDETNPDYILPFTETFEALTVGALDEQHGWSGGGTVQQTSAVHAGAQALALAEDSVSHFFVGEKTNVWVTLWAQPVFSEVAGEIPSNAVAPFYVNTNAQVVAYSNATPITLTPPTVSNGWNKIEVFCDYSSKVWKLSLNGTELFADFAFYSDQAAFSAFELVEGSADNSYFDDLEITDSQDDADGDGLPDDWEILYYGDTSVSPTTTASNGVNTVEQTYIAGLNPTDPDALFVLDSLEPLQWTATSGRVYSVWWTSNLLSSFHLLESNYTGGVYTDLTHDADSQGFYKIDVRIE